jgi:subtilisin-like proprotein convertase family protein
MHRLTRYAVSTGAVAALGASLLTGAPTAVAATASYESPGRVLIETRYGPQMAGTDITVPATGTGPAAASSYPWSVTVPETAAKVTRVGVTLYGLQHTNPDDLDIMLVGPTGIGVMLLSDAGGSVDVNASLMYLHDDGTPVAAPSAPDETSLKPTSDIPRYRPTNHGATDAMPAPAPATPATSLYAFNGTNPSGTWSLLVYDDQTGEVGGIGDWRLEVSTDLPVPSTAAPFPASVTVSGATKVVTDVDVTLNGLTHGGLDMLDLLLVAPGGQKALLMSDAGGTPTLSGDASNANVTFDDEAAGTIPNSWLNLPTGSYRPVNYDDGGTDTFPGVDTTGAVTGLSVFDGTDPNGTWKLYVVEDAVGGGGEIARGWSLRLSTDTTAPTGSVVVNGGSTTSRTAGVTLALAAADTESSVTSMRFSNDGTTWSTFVPYATSAAWTLTSAPGSKTVYAQFADAAGNVSAAVSDTITFDAVKPQVGLTRPATGADGVRAGKNIKVFFSEKVARATLTKTNVKLMRKGSTKAVRATLRYDEIRRKLVIDPKRALRPDTTYKVLIRTGVKDLAGNNLDQKRRTGLQPKRFRFTTR